MTVETTATLDVGRFTVTCLCDAWGPFTLATRNSTFPDASSADWERARRVDRAAFGSDDRWNLSFRCFLIHGPGSTVTLVDTGVGPSDGPAASWAPVPGQLPQLLTDADVDPGDVDLVIQTHLHADHIGWAVTNSMPTFPNARYVIHHDEVDALDQAGSTLVESVLQPLRRTGQLNEITRQTRLAGDGASEGYRIEAVPTPGHTPGHQSVLVSDGDEQFVITGDVLVHAVQLVNPDVGYAFEGDRVIAATSRKALLARAREHGAVLGTAHLNHPFIPTEMWAT